MSFLCWGYWIKKSLFLFDLLFLLILDLFMVFALIFLAQLFFVQAYIALLYFLFFEVSLVVMCRIRLILFSNCYHSIRLLVFLIFFFVFVLFYCLFNLLFQFQDLQSFCYRMFKVIINYFVIQYFFFIFVNQSYFVKD